MGEGDRVRIAAMLPAQAKRQVGIGGSALAAGDSHQSSHSFLVQGLERVRTKDPLVDVILREQLFGVVPAQAVCHLGEVVGSEREEVRGFVQVWQGSRSYAVTDLYNLAGRCRSILPMPQVSVERCGVR